jgi:hypothetical protein
VHPATTHIHTTALPTPVYVAHRSPPTRRSHAYAARTPVPEKHLSSPLTNGHRSTDGTLQVSEKMATAVAAGMHWALAQQLLEASAAALLAPQGPGAAASPQPPPSRHAGGAAEKLSMPLHTAGLVAVSLVTRLGACLEPGAGGGLLWKVLQVAAPAPPVLHFTARMCVVAILGGHGFAKLSESAGTLSLEAVMRYQNGFASPFQCVAWLHEAARGTA